MRFNNNDDAMRRRWGWLGRGARAALCGAVALAFVLTLAMAGGVRPGVAGEDAGGDAAKNSPAASDAPAKPAAPDAPAKPDAPKNPATSETPAKPAAPGGQEKPAADPVAAALPDDPQPAKPGQTALPMPAGVYEMERLVARGETFSAQLAGQEALAALLAGAAEDRPLRLAVAECLLARLLALATANGESAELAKALAPVASSEEATPWFRLLANRALAEASLRAGHRATAAAACERLGLLRDFAVLGPFANERGHAFGEDLLRGKDGAGQGETAPPDFAQEFPGKKKTIRWRHFHNDDPLGVLDLTALCQPDIEALAYVAVAVECARPTAAVLRLGADDTLAVWVNGRLAFRNELERDLAFAQDSVPCPLAAGLNLLLFKVGQARADWQLLAALTAPDGSPLEGVSEVTAAVFAGRQRLAEFPPAPASLGDFAVDAGALRTLPDFLRRHPHDARAIYAYARLRADRGVAGRYSQALRREMMRAARLDPDCVAYLLALADLADESGRFKADRDDNLRRLSLLRALAADPGDVAALTALGRHYLDDAESPIHARGYADKACAGNRVAAEANVLLADVYSASGWPARALELLAETGRRHPRHPAVLRALAAAQLENGRVAAALESYRAAIAADHLDAETTRAAAGLLAGARRVADAARCWEAYLDLRPYDLEARRELAGLWLRALSAPAAAAGATPSPVKAPAPGGGATLEKLLAFLDATLAFAPDSAAFHALRGRALLVAGREAEAEREFAAALALDPAQAAVRDFLRSRGHPLPEILPPLPDLAEFVAGLGPEADAAGQESDGGRLVYLNEQVDELNGDGTRRRGVRQVYRVLSASGAEKGRRWPVWFDPETEDVVFTAARVLHGDGSASEAQVVPVRRPGGRQLRVAAFQALAKGEVVEVAYVVSQRRPDFFGDYFGHIQRFRRKERVLRSRYVLRAPKGKALYFQCAGGAPEGRFEETPHGSQWTWEMSGLDPLPDEPFSPPAGELTPEVRVSTFRDWDDLARWYWGLVKSQNALTPEIAETVAELTANCHDAREKAEAIYDWVSTEVRNNAWSFGVHGFKPYNAGAIFTRRFGDCKDKATLINVMARAAGLEAWPVLVRAIDSDTGRGREDLSLPMLYHFNHCISVVEADGKKIFLDGTMRNRTVDALPFTVMGARAVVVRPDRAELVSTPPYRPEDNLWQENATLTLDGEGNADFAFSVHCRGQGSVFLRDWFGNDKTWDQVLKSVGGERYGHVSAAVVDTVGLDPAVDELLPDETTLTARLRLREYAKRAGREMACRLPAPLMSGKFGYDGAVPARMADFAVASRRETAVVLPALFSVERVLRVEFPENWELLNVLTPRTLEFPFGSLRVDAVARGNFAEIKYSLALKQTRVEPADYPAFRRFCLAADRFAALDLQFRRGAE